MPTGTNSRLKIIRNSVRGGWLVALEGILDEQLDRRELIDGLSGIIIFDLDQLRRATSFGVREWVRSMHELRADYVGFVKCRPAIVAQFNMVAGFGAGGDLVSLYAPFACESCGNTVEILFDLRHDYGTICRFTLPELKCPSCGENTEFDDIPEQFFSHVLSRPAPRTPAVADSIMDGEASEKVTRLRLTKSVDKLVTSFKLRGPLTGTASEKIFRRAFDGLEGYVLIDLSDVDAVDEAGVKLLQTAARTANSPPLMLSRVDVDRCRTMTPWLDATTYVVSVLVLAQCQQCGRERLMHAAVPDADLTGDPRFTGYCTSCGDPTEVAIDPSTMKLATTPRQVVSHLRRYDVAARDSTEDKTGLIAGKYERVRDLGSGGMAEVFLAKVRGPEGFNKFVVLKQIHSKLADNAEMIDLFIQEARIAAKITHPNVVQIFDLISSEEQLIIVMEYVLGYNLAEVVTAVKQRGEHIPPGIAARIIADLCSGLDAAHRATDEDDRPIGIVHQDVSPHNVLISSEGMVKLTDFGVAMASHSINQLRRGSVSGKLLYMAPEQLQRDERSICPQTDLFSVGMILYECLFGFLPQRSSAVSYAINQSACEQLAHALPQESVEASENICRVLIGALATDPSARFGTAAEMERLLAPAAVWQGKPVTTAVLREWLGQTMGYVPGSPSSISMRGATNPDVEDDATRPLLLPILH